MDKLIIHQTFGKEHNLVNALILGQWGFCLKEL